MKTLFEYLGSFRRAKQYGVFKKKNIFVRHQKGEFIILLAFLSKFALNDLSCNLENLLLAWNVTDEYLTLWKNDLHAEFVMKCFCHFLIQPYIPILDGWFFWFYLSPAMHFHTFLKATTLTTSLVKHQTYSIDTGLEKWSDNNITLDPEISAVGFHQHTTLPFWLPGRANWFWAPCRSTKFSNIGFSASLIMFKIKVYFGLKCTAHWKIYMNFKNSKNVHSDSAIY